MHRPRRLLSALLATLLAATAVLAATPATAGASQQRDPVIIVAGTFSPAFANEVLASRLRADGYQTWIFELPALGIGDINASSAALDRFADGVRAQTGASKVDLIGHSQGGLVARGYVRWYGGASEVDSLISLGAPHKGASLANLLNGIGFGDCLGVIACQQMSIGSDYLNALNAGDTTVGNVRYTNFYTDQDESVRPIQNATMGDGANNVRIQSHCWFRPVTHIGLILNGTVYSGVRQALEGQHIRLNCWAL